MKFLGTAAVIAPIVLIVLTIWMAFALAGPAGAASPAPLPSKISRHFGDNARGLPGALSHGGVNHCCDCHSRLWLHARGLRPPSAHQGRDSGVSMISPSPL